MQNVDYTLSHKIDTIQHPFKSEHRLFFNKIAFKTRLQSYGVRTPLTFSYITDDRLFDKLWAAQVPLSNFVLKPNHLGNGKGVYVITKKDGQYLEIDGTPIPDPYNYFKQISKTILLHSNHKYKGLILEEKIDTHPKIKAIYGMDRGIADIRLFMMFDKYAFGRFRTPTKDSRYYANFGRGGAVFYIDENGRIADGRSIFRNHSVEHPDTHKNLVGAKVPFWKEIIEEAVKASKLFKIPYHTIDLTVNTDGKPVIIEGESMPGLKDLTPYGTKYMLDTIDKHRFNR